MPMTFLALFAAAIPEVPANIVQAVPENQGFVLRNLIDDNRLYTFDKDEPGKSNCLADCASRFRPLTASDGDKPLGKWTLVRRDDGTDQWALEAKPVYSFAGDAEPVASRDGTMGLMHPIPPIPAG